MKKFIALCLALLLVCGAIATTSSVWADEITDFNDYELQAREIETFNILHSQESSDFGALANLTDPLITADNYGMLQPCLAEEWGTEDSGKTWTFKIRDGVQWVDVNGEEKAPVVAEDWLWAMEWVLNFHKNDAVNTSMPIGMIQGAKDYYDYTKDLDKEEALALGLDKFKEMVGVEAPDEHTLIYTCLAETPYFDTLATYSCLYPLSGKLLEEIGVEGVTALSNETMWYCGPYTCTTFVHMNEKVFTKNPHYWNEDAKLFNTVSVKMVESIDNAFQLYQTGEIDRVRLSESNLETISRSDSNEFHDYLVATRADGHSRQIHFNFAKNNADGSKDDNWNKAAGNLNFRLAWYYGVDMTDYLSRINSLRPYDVANYYYTFPNLVHTSDGKDYVDLVADRIGIHPDDQKFVRYDADKAADYKAKAMEELTAEGVTFPIVCVLWSKSGDQTAIDSAVVFKQMVEDSLGADFITVELQEFVSSRTKEVYDPSLHSIALAGWGADFGDPINFLGQETYGDDNAFYSQSLNKINDAPADSQVVADFKEFTKMVNDANAINDDLDKRYEAFADAEAFYLEKALSVPGYYTKYWELTTVDQTSMIYLPFGIQQYRYVNWATNSEGVTTEMSIQQQADYEANRP